MKVIGRILVNKKVLKHFNLPFMTFFLVEFSIKRIICVSVSIGQVHRALALTTSFGFATGLRGDFSF